MQITSGMKMTRFLLLSIATLLPALASANGYKGGEAGGYKRPAMALKAQVKHVTSARTIGKLADGSTVIAAKGAMGDQIFVLNKDGKLSDAMLASQAIRTVAPAFASVKMGDGSGRGLATMTDHGMRASVNGQNMILSVRGGKLTAVRDGVTARPATQQQLEQSAYQIFEARGGVHGAHGNDWDAAVAKSRDGR